MKQVIYIDVLIAVNLFVNYFILIATSKILCLKRSTARTIVGECLGGIYSLYILLPDQGFLISSLIKFIMSTTIVLTAFKLNSLKIFLKTLVCFYSINFAFSGIMIALWCLYKPNGMQINNGITYFNISPIILIVSTLVAYIIFEISNRILEKNHPKKSNCCVKINFKQKNVILNGMIDTGNALREPFSGLPVIVTSQSNIANLTDIQTADWAENLSGVDLNFRMIPFKTVSGEGVMPAFKANSVIINNSAPKNSYVAICDEKILPDNVQVLVSPELID